MSHRHLAKLRKCHNLSECLGQSLHKYEGKHLLCAMQCEGPGNTFLPLPHSQISWEGNSDFNIFLMNEPMEKNTLLPTKELQALLAFSDL